MLFVYHQEQQRVTFLPQRRNSQEITMGASQVLIHAGSSNSSAAPGNFPMLPRNQELDERLLYYNK